MGRLFTGTDAYLHLSRLGDSQEPLPWKLFSVRVTFSNSVILCYGKTPLFVSKGAICSQIFKRFNNLTKFLVHMSYIRLCMVIAPSLPLGSSFEKLSFLFLKWKLNMPFILKNQCMWMKIKGEEKWAILWGPIAIQINCILFPSMQDLMGHYQENRVTPKW